MWIRPTGCAVNSCGSRREGVHGVLHPLTYRQLYLTVLVTLYTPRGVRVIKCA